MATRGGDGAGGANAKKLRAAESQHPPNPPHEDAVQMLDDDEPCTRIVNDPQLSDQLCEAASRSRPPEDGRQDLLDRPAPASSVRRSPSWVPAQDEDARTRVADGDAVRAEIARGAALPPVPCGQPDNDALPLDDEESTRVVSGGEMQAHLEEATPPPRRTPGAGQPDEVPTRVVSEREVKGASRARKIPPPPPAAAPPEAAPLEEREDATRIERGHKKPLAAQGASEIEPPTRASRGAEASPESQSPPTVSVAGQEPEESTCILDESMMQEVEDAASGAAPSVPGNGVEGPALAGTDPIDKEHRYLGRAFGGFRIVRGVAKGGMASVFLARKEGMGGFTQHAAIKVVHPHYVNEEQFISMFLDEARIAARIDHPNVCRVLDFGTAEGTYYLALEYVNGETWGRTLSAFLRSESAASQRLPALAAHVVSQACEGLHAAHTALNEQGELLHIVHRDISPDNLLVGYDGTVRVLDFGVAHARARLTETRAGIVKGRLSYMAPEQAKGARVTAKADIWSLGVVLREALEQRRLFRRDSEVDTIMAVTHEPLPDWKPGVPEALRAVCDRAMSRDPVQRYDTARDMGLDLIRYLRSLPEAMGTPELSGTMQKLFDERRRERQQWLSQPVPTPRPTGSFDAANPASPGASARHAPTLKMAAVEAPTPKQDKSGWVALAAALLALVVVGSLWVSRFTARRPSAPATTGGSASPLAGSERPEQTAPVPARGAPGSATSEPASAPATDQEVSRPAADGAAAEPTPPATKPEPAAPTARAQADAVEPETPETAPRVQEPRRRAKPARRRAARARPGTVMVVFNGGWAEVYRGGKKLGTTPGRFVVPSGTSVLTLKPFGKPPAIRRRVQVRPGGVTKLRVDR